VPAGAESWEQQDGLSFDDALTKYVGECGKGQVRLLYSGHMTCLTLCRSNCGEEHSSLLPQHVPPGIHPCSMSFDLCAVSCFIPGAATVLGSRRPSMGTQRSHDSVDGLLIRHPNCRQGLGL
jgi:hypothetical protein